MACCDTVNRGAAYSDGKIFYNTLDAHTVAVDATTGQEVWKTQIGNINVGETVTMAPIVAKGKVIAGISGGEMGIRGRLVALDAATGKTIWKVERPTDAPHESPDSYSTPTITEIGGERQLIVSGGDYLTGHNLATGKEMWRAGGLNPNKETNYRTIASPLVEGDMIFAPSRRRPFIAFRKPAKPTSDPVRVWDTEYGPDVPTPTSDGERLYIIDDRGIALCLRTGKRTDISSNEG